jgi:hypothetical protein
VCPRLQSGASAGPLNFTAKALLVRINRSLIAISVGVALAAIISALLAFLAPFYLIPIYNYLARTNAPTISLTHGTAHPILYHPISIGLTLLTSALPVGPAAYFAAWVADRRFVLHALVATAAYLLIAGLFSWDVVIWSPLYFAAIAAWSLLVATGAGCLRMRQKVYSREAL